VLLSFRQNSLPPAEVTDQDKAAPYDQESRQDVPAQFVEWNKITQENQGAQQDQDTSPENRSHSAAGATPTGELTLCFIRGFRVHGFSFLLLL
jgi:hypothetical protein